MVGFDCKFGAHQGGGIYVELDFSEHTKTVLQVGLFFYFLGIKDIDRNAMTICKEHNGKLGRIVCSVSAENSSYSRKCWEEN